MTTTISHCPLVWTDLPCLCPTPFPEPLSAQPCLLLPDFSSLSYLSNRETYIFRLLIPDCPLSQMANEGTMIHHVPRQLKQPQSTFCSVPQGKYTVFPGEPQDFMAFPSLPPSVLAGTAGSFPPSPAWMLGHFSLCLQPCRLSTHRGWLCQGSQVMPLHPWSQG